MTVTLSQTVVVFAKDDRLTVRLYDNPQEAAEAVRSALAAGTVDAAGQGRFYRISSQQKPPAGEPNA